ncbi:MAG: hypothetical protein GY918_13155, partial [Gammaproteobacteria bacterium]|nr:hypothetical protein [Gammaproteobacteria bacterium]
ALTNNNPGYGLVPGDSNPTPPIVSRYFAWNETTRYATIPEVTLAGDFSGVVQFATTSASQSTVFSGVSSNESSVIVDVKPGEVRFFAYNSGGELVGVVVFSGSYNDGVLHNVAFSLSGANASLSVDGGEPVIAAWVGYDTASIGVLYQRADGTGSFKGIIANLRIWDNSTLIRDYPIDDDSNTLVDHASGQDGSVINGIQADWGLFEEQSTGEWLGQELVVNGGFDSDSNWILGVGWS